MITFKPEVGAETSSGRHTAFRLRLTVFLPVGNRPLLVSIIPELAHSV